MLLNYIRLIKYDSSLVDYSLNNYDEAATVPVSLEANDYLYIGQRIPFNNIFFHMNATNSASGTMAAEYWDGTNWRDAVDVLDGTVSGGVTLGRSGNYKFSLDDDYSWQMVTNTEDSNSPTELNTLNIYNTYWLRLQPQNNMSASVTAKEIGYAFTTTEKIKSFDVEINSYFSSFESGKTDWIDEIKMASKLVVDDLRSKGLIIHPGQIIELDDVWLPTTLKTLWLIYGNLGPSYKERRLDIDKQYQKSISNKRFSFDDDADGRIQQSELNSKITSRTR